MELKKRTLVKTITYRLVGILATVPFTGWGTALSVHLLLAVIYYAHERAWMRVKWGKTE